MTIKNSEKLDKKIKKKISKLNNELQLLNSILDINNRKSEFKKTTDEIINSFEFKDFSDFINTCSHFKKHTLVAAIYNMTKIALLKEDYSQGEFEKRHTDLKEEDVYESALHAIKISEQTYLENKLNIDNAEKLRIN